MNTELLAPIEVLVANEEAHRYCFRGDWLPFSVTGVISDLSEAARKQIARTKEGPDGWELRGNTVHGILEQHLRGIASGGLHGVIYDDRWGPWAEPLLDHWLFRDCQVLAVEYALCDPVKRVGGCVDFLVRTDQGQTILGDLKTVSSAAALLTVFRSPKIVCPWSVRTKKSTHPPTRLTGSQSAYSTASTWQSLNSQ